jgi:hypothetical protein
VRKWHRGEEEDRAHRKVKIWLAAWVAIVVLYLALPWQYHLPWPWPGSDGLWLFRENRHTGTRQMLIHHNHWQWLSIRPVDDGEQEYRAESDYDRPHRWAE